MNGFLLDTHVWLWSLMEPKRLAPRISNRLLSEPELYLSPISIWETILLAEKKRIELTPDPITWVRKMLSESPVREAPLNHEIAIRSRTLQIRVKDPADRFLLATAEIFRLTLLTMDSKLSRYSEVRD